MGNNTFVTAIDETGQSTSATINILDPEFIEGVWTKDKEGKIPLEKAMLGDTVYFHVKTKGIAKDGKVTLTLTEYDYSLWGYLINPLAGYIMSDELDPDEREFAGKEVKREAIINNKGNAYIEVFLEENWEGEIADDGILTGKGQDIELYWEATYGNIKKILPNDTDNYLRVTQNNKSLYIKPFEGGHNMPEFFDYKGNPLAYMKVLVNKNIDPGLKKDLGKQHANETLKFGLDIARDEGLKKVAKKSQVKTAEIALARFEKATLSAESTPYSPNILNDYYTHDEKIINKIKGEKEWGKVLKDNGVQPLEYYGKTGTKMKILGLLNKADEITGTAFDMFDLFKFSMNDLDTSNPLSFPGIGALGPVGAAFTLLNGVAGMLVKQIKDEQDAYMEEIVQKEVNEAKLKGLDATREAIKTWNHNNEYDWDLISVSNQTANKLLEGEFNSFEELRTYNDLNDGFDSYDNKITILYRQVKNENKEMYINIIESIFIDE